MPRDLGLVGLRRERAIVSLATAGIRGTHRSRRRRRGINDPVREQEQVLAQAKAFKAIEVTHTVYQQAL